jgi:aminoglycoside phosphotransferase (APT) family kinase protein
VTNPPRPNTVGDGAPNTCDPHDDIADKLRSVLHGVLSNAEQILIAGLHRTSTGLSRENWIFDAHWLERGEARSRRMILRRDPPASLLATDRRREFDVLRALEQTPVPAPAVRWVDNGESVFGAPALIMDVVEGRCDWHVLNGKLPLAERLSLAHRFIEVLAQIQRVDWRTLGLGDPSQEPGPQAELDHWEGELRRVQLEPLPEMEFALSWLRRHAPVAQDVVLVHGDFKPGNALLLDGDISAILDWETAHLGDPLEDLGWITNPPRAREQQIRGVWEREQIVQAFTAATGYRVDTGALQWWNVFSCWKLSVIVLTGVHGFVAGEMDRVYHSPAWLFQQMFSMMQDGTNAPNG